MSLVPDSSTDPFDAFAQWFAEAEATEPVDANAMILATVSASGQPSARTVLLKGWDEDGFVFYTNTQSRKGDDLAANPRAALLFYWKSIYRQVRIEGLATPVSEAEADAYFHSRPRGSQVGAWASDQSRPMTGGRATLEQRLADAEARFQDIETIPRPDYWSGYRVSPERFEFWQGRDFRLHDRAVFSRDGGGWVCEALYP